MATKAEAAPTAPFRDQGGNKTALLIIDMITCLDFAGAEVMGSRALDAARAIKRLRGEVEARGWPVIYVNDNFGEWHSERTRLVERALEGDNAVSAEIVPDEQDYFIIKPQFSGFYATNLPVLLPKLGVSRLILTGMATDVCVLFTAGDAHMRDYALRVPSDTVAAQSEERGCWALDLMANALGAETAPTDQLSLDDWLAALDKR